MDSPPPGAKKRGRPPRLDNAKLISFRLGEGVRQQLQSAAYAAKRSLSEELAHRLEASFARDCGIDRSALPPGWVEELHEANQRLLPMLAPDAPLIWAEYHRAIAKAVSDLDELRDQSESGAADLAADLKALRADFDRYVDQQRQRETARRYPQAAREALLAVANKGDPNAPEFVTLSEVEEFGEKDAVVGLERCLMMAQECFRAYRPFFRYGSPAAKLLDKLEVAFAEARSALEQPREQSRDASDQAVTAKGSEA